MSPSKIDYWKIFHILIGGAIYFAAIFVLEIVTQSTADWIFRTLGILGVFAFEEAQNAYYVIRLGVIYSASGFFSGLYTGYKVKENLKLIMSFPSLIGFLLMLAINYGVLLTSFSLMRITKFVAVPLIVSLIGSYLGGYTVNWQVEEKIKEEKISLMEIEL